MITAAAFTQPDFNTLSLVALAFMVLVFGPRYFRASAAKYREADLKASIDAQRERIESLEQVEKDHLRVIGELREEVRQCHVATAAWEARYNEQSKYTAPEAFAIVAKELEASRVAMTTGLGAMSDLLMQVLETSSRTYEIASAKAA